jgi:hypothetical protein
MLTPKQMVVSNYTPRNSSTVNCWRLAAVLSTEGHLEAGHKMEVVLDTGKTVDDIPEALSVVAPTAV